MMENIKFIAFDLDGTLVDSVPDLAEALRSMLADLNLASVTNDEVKQNILYQYSEHIKDNYKYSEPYGVDPLLTSKYEGGSSLQIDFEKYLDKRKVVQYITQIYTFYGWITELAAENKYTDYDAYLNALDVWSDNNQVGVKPTLSNHPVIRWENSIKIKATEYLSTQVDFKLYYNRAIDRAVQTYTYVDIGLTYTFKNK